MGQVSKKNANDGTLAKPVIAGSLPRSSGWTGSTRPWQRVGRYILSTDARRSGNLRR